MKKWMTVAAFLPLIILSLGVGAVLKFIAEDNLNDYMNPLYTSVRIISGIIRFGIILVAIISIKKEKDRRKRNALRYFCFSYLLGFTIYYILRRDLPFLDHDFMFYLNPFIYVALNIPPLILARRYIHHLYKPFLFSADGSLKIDQIAELYKLTGREREIFQLILLGKSNMEIKDELFISYRTVKNHIYNLFKKLGITNRVQLFSLIQNGK